MALKGRGQRVNREELAEVFGVSLNTVTSWLRAGCPYDNQGKQGRPWQFNTRDVSQWLQEVARDEHPARSTADEYEWRLRKLAAETALAERALADRKKQYALMSELNRASALLDEAVRSSILRVPDRVASQLVGEKNEGRFMQVLSAELVRALEEAANTDFELTPDEPDQEHSECH